MAVTKIWPVKGRLDAVIRYAGNEEKTRLPDLTGLSAGKDDLSDVLQYAANDATTTPNYRPPHPAMREDYRRWAEIEKQLHLLERHSLNTAEDVAAFTSEQEQKLTDLESRRTKCRNRLRRCRDPTECEALHTEKDELTKQITEIRKELHTAQQIPSRVKRMRENIQLLNDREQQRAAHRKER